MHTLLLLALAGCAGSSSDDKGNDDTGDAGSVETCGFRGEFTGAAEVSLDYGDAEGCSGSAADDRVALSFGVLDVDHAVYIELSGATEGEVASDLPAAVELADLAVGYDGWRTGETGCTVDFTEMIEDDFFGFIVVGSGTCSEAATPDTDDVTGEVTVGPFEFRAPGGWG